MVPDGFFGTVSLNQVLCNCLAAGLAWRRTSFAIESCISNALFVRLVIVYTQSQALHGVFGLEEPARDGEILS